MRRGIGSGALGAAAASTDTGRDILSVFTGTTAPLPNARELQQPEPELAMASPDFRALVDDWTVNPNLQNVSLPTLPVGTDTVAIPPGMTHDDVFADMYLKLFDESVFDSTNQTMTTVALSSLIDTYIVQAWYH